MTDKTQALLPVTQADRNAAADAVKSYREQKNGNWQQRIRDGLCDDGEMVQAFTRHRLSHSNPAHMLAALEPFTCDDFETPITDEQGWTEFGLSWSRERIRDWFGPSAFRRARETYRAALTPSPCPGDVGTASAIEADIALLGARMVLEGKATNATGALAKSDWKPSRAHIEGMRNTMREAIEYIDEALAALTPSALSDLQRLGQEYDGAALREARLLPGQVPPFLSAPDFDDRNEERACINGCLYLRADFAAQKFAALDHPAQTAPSALSGDAGEGWHLIDSAPKDGTEIQARIPGNGEDNVIAWVDGLIDCNNEYCGAWAFTRDQEPPDCWTDGYCWTVNEDGDQSVQPTHWKALPSHQGAE